MSNALVWILIILVIAAIGAVGWRIFAGRLSDRLGGGLFRQPRHAPRIDVIESTVLDAKRRLILIRRDDVEHLIMTGGPVDVVIETGIEDGDGEARMAAPAPVARAPAFARPSRVFGQVLRRPPAVPVDPATDAVRAEPTLHGNDGEYR